MRRSSWLAFVVLLMVTATASARGFRRATEVRPSNYYAPSYSFYYPVAPQVVYSYSVPTPVHVARPIYVEPTVRYAPPVTYTPAVTFAPPVDFTPITFATPAAAPAAEIEEPRLTPRPLPIERAAPSTSLRPGESFYSVTPGPRGRDTGDQYCSVAFWNLTRGALSVRIDGRDHVIGAGRRLTLELPRSFAWHVNGREAEATRIAAGHSTAEVFIRR